MRRAAFLLMALMLVVLATATVIEKFYGTETVYQWIYGSVPFVLLWLVITDDEEVFSRLITLRRRHIIADKKGIDSQFFRDICLTLIRQIMIHHQPV